MTSSTQVARLLALVPYLQTHPNAPVAEVASLFHVTPRQLLADLDVLWYCGLPQGLPGDLIEVDMDAVRAEGRIRLTNAEYLSRPLRFTVEEAMSLVVALRAIRELAGEQVAGLVDSLLAKLEGLTGANHAGPVSFSVLSGEVAIRDVLTRAIAQRRAVRLTYDGQTRAQTTSPLVDPARLATRDGFAYLDAWSRERGAWRTFRLDRIAAAELTDLPSDDHGEPPTPQGNWLESRPEAALVRLDLDDSARWVAEYYPVRGATPRPGGVRVDLLVADPAWLRALLLRLGPAVRAVEPTDARSSAVAAARETLALYQLLPLCDKVEP